MAQTLVVNNGAGTFALAKAIKVFDYHGLTLAIYSKVNAITDESGTMTGYSDSGKTCRKCIEVSTGLELSNVRVYASDIGDPVKNITEELDRVGGIEWLKPILAREHNQKAIKDTKAMYEKYGLDIPTVKTKKKKKMAFDFSGCDRIIESNEDFIRFTAMNGKCTYGLRHDWYMGRNNTYIDRLVKQSIANSCPEVVDYFLNEVTNTIENTKVYDGNYPSIEHFKDIMQELHDSITPKQVETKEEPVKTETVSHRFDTILAELAKYQGIQIENKNNRVLWVSGKTYPIKETLKKYGMRWAPRKKGWWITCQMVKAS